MNNSTKNFLEFLYEHLGRSAYHMLLGNVLLGNRHNNFCCPNRNADIVVSLHLSGLYSFSLTNEGQRSFAKSSFLKYFNMFSKSQTLSSNSRVKLNVNYAEFFRLTNELIICHMYQKEHLNLINYVHFLQLNRTLLLTH